MRATLDRVSDDTELDPKRVLVVNGEEAMLRTHARVLSAHGFRPVTLLDPLEALAEVERTLPCVIVMDLLMPGLSGLDLATQLRTRHGRACPPLVLVSADLAQLAPMEQILFDVLFPNPYGVDGFIGWVSKLARCHVDRRQAPSHVERSELGRERDAAMEALAEDGED